MQTRDAPTFFALVTEHSGRPRVDLDPVDHVGGDPAPGQHGEILGIRADGADRLRGFVHEKGGPHGGNLFPTLDHARADLDDGLDHSALRAGNDDAAQPPFDGITRLPLREHVLDRLVQHDAREQRTLGQAAAVAQHGHCTLHFRAREHLERMHRHSVTTTLRASAARPSGSPAATAVAPVQLRTISAVASGSGSWLLCDSNASILRSTASVMST